MIPLFLEMPIPIPGLQGLSPALRLLGWPGQPLRWPLDAVRNQQQTAMGRS